MRDRGAKEVSENDTHDQQREQRIQNAPHRNEDRAFAFPVKIPSDQFHNPKAVFSAL